LKSISFVILLFFIIIQITILNILIAIKTIHIITILTINSGLPIAAALAGAMNTIYYSDALFPDGSNLAS